MLKLTQVAGGKSDLSQSQDGFSPLYLSSFAGFPDKKTNA